MKRTRPTALESLYGSRWNERLAAMTFRWGALIGLIMVMLAISLQVNHAAAQPILLTRDALNLTDISDVGAYFGLDVQGAMTAFAIWATVLVTFTYTTLISAGGRLSSTSKLPMVSLERNIGALLSLTWPDDSAAVDADTPAGNTARRDAIRLLYVGKMDDDDDGSDSRRARGLRQCAASPEAFIPRSHLWLTSGSPLTKDIVQMAVWEWLSVWLTVALIVTTVLYNGFTTADLTPDSWPRLTVVLIYSMAFCSHLLYVWRSCTTFFTMVGAGASWSLLNRANFSVVEREQLHQHLTDSKPNRGLDFRQIDKASEEFIPATYSASLVHTSSITSEQSMIKTEEAESRRAVKAALATIKAIQATERVEARKAATRALERVVANCMLIMAVVISYGFSVWTGRIVNADSNELGSLALLGSLSLGVGAMFTSAVQLNIMNNSFRTIVYLKEIKINGHAIDHGAKRPARTRAIGFTQGTIKAHAVQLRDIVRASSVRGLFCLLLFGPAHTLLPTEAEEARQSANIQYVLQVRVRDERVHLTTERTDRHSQDANGFNHEAINVCHFPRRAQTYVPG